MEKLRNILKSAFKNIYSNKLRSALTALGLIIGITSVILLVGIGKGAGSNVTSSVKSLGTGVLTISIDSDYSIEYSDISSIAQISNVEYVVPYLTISSTVNKGETVANRANILATTSDYIATMNLGIKAGREISFVDQENTSKVCLIGGTMADTLFENTIAEDIVGQKISIGGDKYTIVGILSKVGSTMGTNVDNMIIIPFETAKYLSSDLSINNLVVKVEDEDKIEITSNLIEKTLKSKLGITSDDVVEVTSQDSMLDTMSDINSTMNLLLGGIAGISLIVGGIGVMNVMLVSVTERTKEIEIRKALGAKRKDILIQFLIEALILCLLGGIIGIAIGLITGYILNIFGFNFTASNKIILISFLSSAFIGIVFGIFPAYKASKLNPIDALRTE